MNEIVDRYKLEDKEEWDKWRGEIPEMQLKQDWKIKVVPPFAGAIVRFFITKEKASVSVYLDCYEKLGYFGSPYWEMYPYDDDVYRVGIDEMDELITRIDESIEKQISDRTASSS